MLRRTRERLRAKLGRALEDYVTREVRQQADRLAEDLRAVRDEVAGLHARLEEARSAEGRLIDHMRAWERRQRRDMATISDIRAAQSSEVFAQAELDRAAAHPSPGDTRIGALEAAPAEGLFLEFGVASGGTLRMIAERAPEGSVFGFDSFEGLPEHWRSGFEEGTFAQDWMPDVPGAELVVGWFDQTLPGFLEAHPGPVAFLHLDADLYSSTVVVLEALESRLRPGTVLLFDEYFNFPGWEAHEHRAWTEFVARTGIRFEYLGYTVDDEQLSLRLTAVPGYESVSSSGAPASAQQPGDG
ncbi:class I SAM-dependent methyltransferase [Blastococcus sp. TBT05-19]|uniref:class I SAM-dependent methyltransferase n=1 Tax=Blastococcus sp. TBT05-19 TaxID=2250581 RepID=UPI000DE8D528|nr:class I SAM-dependent methyltransferase [Blastococcus sp. TBT05-19]RBY91744.1 class I SAM-dependent methyltransferase [Blastococcus sp. TBT05-19]